MASDRRGTDGFDHNNISTEVFGASTIEQTFLVDVDRDGLADIIHVSEDDSRSIRTYRALGNGTFSRTAIVTSGINNAGVGAGVFAGSRPTRRASSSTSRATRIPTTCSPPTSD